jgi:hypothetical protein
MRKSVASAAALVLALLAGEAVAQSGRSARSARWDETGVAGIHSWVKAGRKTCMVDHFHYGSGTGPTRALAERAAIRSWTDFTAWEYGHAWGRYAFAATKKATCTREEPRSWRCAVEARPCRPF